MHQRLDFHGSLILSYAISVIATRIFLEIFKTRIKYLLKKKGINVGRLGVKIKIFIEYNFNG